MQVPAYEPVELGVNCMVHNDVSWAWKKVICIIDISIIVVLLMPMPEFEEVDEGMLEVMVILIELISIVKKS